MLPGARRRALLEYLSEAGTASIVELSTRFHVSSMTIRRDLKTLQQQGMVSLTHGGAIFELDPFHQRETHRRERETLQAAEKYAIGRYAAKFVEPNDVLILDSGTTVRAIVPFLKSSANLTVTTTNLRTIEALHRHVPDCSILCTGGILRSDSLTFIGPVAERYFDDFFARKAFISRYRLYRSSRARRFRDVGYGREEGDDPLGGNLHCGHRFQQDRHDGDVASANHAGTQDLGHGSGNSGLHSSGIGRRRRGCAYRADASAAT